MSEDMVEKVARALCAADGLDPDEKIQGDFRTFAVELPDASDAVPDMVYYEPRWHARRRYARAAIEALREPTVAMSNAVHATDLEDGQHAVWRAMIDAALNPPQ